MSLGVVVSRGRFNRTMAQTFEQVWDEAELAHDAAEKAWNEARTAYNNAAEAFKLVALAEKGYAIGDDFTIPENHVLKGNLACITGVSTGYSDKKALTINYRRYGKNGQLRASEGWSIKLSKLPILRVAC